MKLTHTIILSICTLLTGMILFAWFHDLIIIRSPWQAHTYTAAVQATKQPVTLHYWQNNAWHSEARDIIWHHDTSTDLALLLNNWCNVLDEEKIIDKKVTIQTTLLAATGHEVYISFDRNPLNKEASTFEKWMFIEGLLKTIRENKVPIQQVRFLVQHQLLHDTHLDFSNPWPIQGFTKA